MDCKADVEVLWFPKDSSPSENDLDISPKSETQSLCQMTILEVQLKNSWWVGSGSFPGAVPGSMKYDMAC